MTVNVQDAPAIPAPPKPRSATDHTVTIETLTAAELTAAGYLSFNPRRAVIGQRGRVRLIVAVDGDAFLRASLEDIAGAHAAWHGATYIPPAPPRCGYCPPTVAVCPDPWTHARWLADRDPREPRDTEPTRIAA
jgi:hypothetical protein